MPDHFDVSDLRDLWMDAPYATENYVAAPPSDAVVAEVERQLGFRLPAAWIELARRSQNGGLLSMARNSHRCATPTSWAADHVAVNGFFSIGGTVRYAVTGAAGSRFWIEHWSYPPIGVYFADCPSAGHDMIALDYRACGPQGEPSVVHVDQDRGFAITPLADDFASFVGGLTSTDAIRGA
jgi:hypothetical protein